MPQSIRRSTMIAKLSWLTCSILVASVLAPAVASPSSAAASVLSTTESQESEKKAVLAAVQELFDAMKAGDAEKAAEVLVIEGQFLSVRPGESEDATVIRAQSNEVFLDQLAGAENEWLERMWDAEVKIHGNLAMVWTPYDFHRDGEFSHCGIDALDLIKVDGTWKVAGGTYTVEPEGCDDSPLGPPGAEGKRHLRIEDSFAIERVGSPRISPDVAEGEQERDPHLDGSRRRWRSDADDRQGQLGEPAALEPQWQVSFVPREPGRREDAGLGPGSTWRRGRAAHR